MRIPESLSRGVVAIELVAGALAVYFAGLGLLLATLALFGGEVTVDSGVIGLAGIAAFAAVGAMTQFVFAGRKGVRDIPMGAFACMWVGVGLVGMSYFFDRFQVFRLALPLVVATLHLTLERMFAGRT